MYQILESQQRPHISPSWASYRVSGVRILKKIDCVITALRTIVVWYWSFNSLAPGRFEWNYKQLLFKLTLGIHGWGISCEIALRWMSLYLIDDKSTLVQVMACCLKATSHYPNQCWPRRVPPYVVTRPQWVNPYTSGQRHWPAPLEQSSDCLCAKEALLKYIDEVCNMNLQEFKT